MANKKSPTICVYNCSKQMIPIQVRPPGGDFFKSEHQIRLAPGKSVTLIKSHVRQEQIDNLQQRRMIKVVHDSEK